MLLTIVLHTFNPRTLDADLWVSGMVCGVSYRLARASSGYFASNKTKTKHKTYRMYLNLYECMLHVCWCLWRPEEGLGSTRAGVTGDCEHLSGGSPLPIAFYLSFPGRWQLPSLSDKEPMSRQKLLFQRTCLTTKLVSPTIRTTASGHSSKPPLSGFLGSLSAFMWSLWSQGLLPPGVTGMQPPTGLMWSVWSLSPQDTARPSTAWCVDFMTDLCNVKNKWTLRIYSNQYLIKWILKRIRKDNNFLGESNASNGGGGTAGGGATGLGLYAEQM